MPRRSQRRPALSSKRNGASCSFAIPAFYFAIYFAVVTARFGTWYSVHALTGAVLLSGVAGLLLSYVALPPQVTEAGPQAG